MKLNISYIFDNKISKQMKINFMYCKKAGKKLVILNLYFTYKYLNFVMLKTKFELRTSTL